jgi:hypothetical protein
MAVQELLTASVPTAGDKPRDDEIDLFGLTHVGKVRSENQDHFLLCTLHREMLVYGTSLPAVDQLPLRSERMATLGIVADGAGGSAAGGAASHLAVATIARYVTHTMECFYGNDPTDEARPPSSPTWKAWPRRSRWSWACGLTPTWSRSATRAAITGPTGDWNA